MPTGRSTAEGAVHGETERRLTTAQLKARAVAMLARREHSRNEIVRRLAPLAESVEQLDAALDQLAADGLLSEARFAQSLARRRSDRFGAARVARELQQHGVDPAVADPLLGSLRETERERALQVWNKRFGEPATSLADKARQYRFLAQRGFSADAINEVLRETAP